MFKLFFWFVGDAKQKVPQGHGESYPPPIPGFPGDSNIYALSGKKNRRYFDTLRLHLRQVRDLQIAGGNQYFFIHRACDSLQIGLTQVLNRGLHLDFEVPQWSKLDEIWGTHNETNNSPQLNICTALVDSYFIQLTSNYCQRN